MHYDFESSTPLLALASIVIFDLLVHPPMHLVCYPHNQLVDYTRLLVVVPSFVHLDYLVEVLLAKLSVVFPPDIHAAAMFSLFPVITTKVSECVP